MGVPWTSLVFAKHLQGYGCVIPPDCIEIKFICTPDICRVLFKKLAITDKYSDQIKQEFSESVSSGIRTVIANRYENCCSYTVTAKANDVVIVEVLQYGGAFEADLISNLLSR